MLDRIGAWIVDGVERAYNAGEDSAAIDSLCERHPDYPTALEVAYNGCRHRRNPYRLPWTRAAWRRGRAAMMRSER